MVNLGFNLASLLGLLDVLLALVIFVATLVMILNESKKKSSSRIVFDITQLIFIPLAMLLCGGIFLFQGWRLDPILLFAMLL